MRSTSCTSPTATRRPSRCSGKGETFGVFQLESAGMRALRPGPPADDHRRPLRAWSRSTAPARCSTSRASSMASTGGSPITLPAPGPRRHPRRDLRRHRLPGPGAAHRAAVRRLLARPGRHHAQGDGQEERRDHGRRSASASSRAPSRTATPRATPTPVFDLIEPFAGYAFNKAHSWCYGTHRLPDRLAEGELPGPVHDRRAPDVEERAATPTRASPRPSPSAPARHRSSAARRELSVENFSVEPREDGSLAIRFGLGVVKNVGSSAVEGIVAARRRRPLPRHRRLLQTRRPRSANTRAIEHLAQAGAFDLLGDRGTLLATSTAARTSPAANASCAIAASRRCSTSLAARSTRPSRLRTAGEPRPARGLARLGEGAARRLRLGPPLQADRERCRPRLAHGRRPHDRHEGPDRDHRGLVNRVQRRTTRDGRKFYVVDLEDLSGTAELTVWNDTIELTGEEIWAEGQVLVCSVECRDRGDRLTLAVEDLCGYDLDAGAPIGFDPARFRVKAPRRRAPEPALSVGDESAPYDFEAPRALGARRGQHRRTRPPAPRRLRAGPGSPRPARDPHRGAHRPSTPPHRDGRDHR